MGLAAPGLGIAVLFIRFYVIMLEKDWTFFDDIQFVLQSQLTGNHRALIPTDEYTTSDHHYCILSSFCLFFLPFLLGGASCEQI